MIYLYVAVGGVLGALARFAIGGWATGGHGGFPWGTLLVNVLGALLLGVLVQTLPARGASPEIRALLTVGFCGSFTTFSTFGLEAVELWTGGAPLLAAAYVGASLVLGLTAVAAGVWLGGALG